MGHGIDYGMGQTNIDRETGIRFGVIHSGDVCQAWSDSAESDYGTPTCPKCGNDAVDADTDSPEQTACVNCRESIPCRCDNPTDRDSTRDDLGYETERGACGDYACDSCRYLFDGEDAFGESPLAWTLDDGEYKASQSGEDCDIFILKAPYYTHAQFCSPCAPGACSLSCPVDETGPKAYCFGHNWFDDGKAPYPVYSVATGELVNPS